MTPDTPPDSCDRLLEQAATAYRAGRFDEAETRCNRVLALANDNFAALQLLAAVAANKGEPARGIEFMRQALSLRPEAADGYVELAKLLRLEGRLAECVEALNTAIDREADCAAAYNDLGLVRLAQGDTAAAETCFTRAIEIDPDLAIAHYNKALAFERSGNVMGAIECFRRVVTIDPNFAEAYAKLANLLLHDGDRREALECFDRAAAAKPDTTLAFMCEAKSLIETGKPVAAEEIIRRAIDRDPQNSDVHCLRGSILMELGRFLDAAAAFDLGLSLNRNQIAAYHELVHVRKLTNADRPLIAQMEWILREQPLGDEGRADLQFALGKAYDDLGEYENAIHHFDAANIVKHRMTSFNAERHSAIVDRMIDRFTPDFFAQAVTVGCDSDLPILVVGMPRSGTTLVEQILSSHPRIGAAGELTFWGERSLGFGINAAGRVDPNWVAQTAKDYLALLTDISPGSRHVTDKRPQNFHYLALAHIAFPRARIIHCRRNPVDTCLSIYFQNFARRIDFAYDRADLLACYRNYQRLMAHWRQVLPADRFLEIQYEELVADREPVTRKMIEFCGLAWDDACLHSERNLRPVRTASVWQARQPVYRTSVARWQHYEPWLGPLRELLTEADVASR